MTIKAMKQDRPIWIHGDEFRRATEFLSPQQGGFLLFLLTTYATERREIPKDDQSIADLLGTSVEIWRRVRPPVLQAYKRLKHHVRGPGMRHIKVQP